MDFKISNFIVCTEHKQEQLKDQIAAATAIKSGKPSVYEWQHKIREFNIFSALSLLEQKENKYYRVIDDMFEFIDLIEMLKAFNSNRLDTEKTYIIGDSFASKVVRKDEKYSLKIQFLNHKNILYLDKYECGALAAKFSKILQRCEAWQESGV